MERFGTVKMDEDCRIEEFEEKPIVAKTTGNKAVFHLRTHIVFCRRQIAHFRTYVGVLLEEVPYVVIASGDCVYKMDFNKLLEYHIAKKADITVVHAVIIAAC